MSDHKAVLAVCVGASLVAGFLGGHFSAPSAPTYILSAGVGLDRVATRPATVNYDAQIKDIGLNYAGMVTLYFTDGGNCTKATWDADPLTGGMYTAGDRVRVQGILDGNRNNRRAMESCSVSHILPASED